MNKTVIIISIIWCIISGVTLDSYLILGIITITSVIVISLYLKIIPKENKINVKNIYKYFIYVVWIIYQNIISSLFFIKLAWSKNINIEGKIVNITINNLDKMNNNQKIIFTNSVTFTPGTCTIFLDEKNIYIHSITEEMSIGIEKILSKIKNNISFIHT